MPHGKDPLRAADVRLRNEKIVLRLIHTEGARGLSQSEAVVATGLEAPTIFRIFSNLETAGLIEILPSPSHEPALADAAAREDGKLERKGRRPDVHVPPPLRRERCVRRLGRDPPRGGRHDDRDGPHPGRCRWAGVLLRRERLSRSLSRSPRPAEPRGGGTLFESLGAEAAAVLTRAATYLAQAVRIASRLFSPRSFLFVAASAAVAEALSARVRDLVVREISGSGRVLPEFHARAYDLVLAQRGAAALVLDAYFG